jgi:proline iminopeptidase
MKRSFLFARLSRVALVVLVAICTPFGLGLETRPALSAAPEPRHPAGRFVSVLDKQIWCEVAGDGEPLVLIPGGGGGSHDYYHPFLSPLSKKFRVIYYDGFGRGKSQRAASPGEYSFARDVEELEALRQALGLQKFNLYGHSYGGFVAQAYAIKYPQWVRRLILSNTFVSGADYQASNDFVNSAIQQFYPEAWDRIVALRKKGRLASSPELGQVSAEIFASMLAQFYFYDPKNIARLAPFSEHNFNAAEYYAIVGADADFTIGPPLASWNAASGLAALPMPILILSGRADGVILPRLARHLVQAAPRARYVMFEKSGHFPFIEENPQYLTELSRFLSK